MPSSRDYTGLCPECRVAYAWQGKPTLRNARCPCCGSALSKYRRDYTVVEMRTQRPESAQVAS